MDQKGKVMKTLDVLIQEFGNMMPEVCDECPFVCLAKSEDDCPMFTALHYLKEYQTLKLGYIKAMADLEDNPQLTWQELRQMEGKPVWVEHKHYNKWLIVYEVYENTIVLDGNGFYTQYFSDDNAKEIRWRAYRKERYEDAR